MRGLNLRLLGRPRLEFDGHPLTRLIGAKPQALVYYLAAEGGGPVPRGQLASLLWGSLDDASARANLRLALTRLRQRLPGVLESDGQAVSLSPQVPAFVDAQRVEAAAQGDDDLPLEVLQQAASCCGGTFLEGFDLPGADAFDDWLRRERARFQRSAVEVMRRVVERLDQAGAIDRAIAAAQRWVELDDTDEAAHRRLMELLARSGRRTAAIAQYESLRNILVESLGARPSAQTYELYRRIHADAPRASIDQAPPAEPEAPRRTAAPVGDAGALVGRQSELTEAGQRLLDPMCRVLTLIGPGGVGKTRLAFALADAHAGRFPEGAVFVSAAALDDGGDRVAMLADAIATQAGARRGGYVEASESLAKALAGRSMLLVLDNLETVPEAGSLVSAIVDGAPQIKVLATSRRRLGGRREWLYEVPGLSLVAGSCERLSPAAQLFVREASRLVAGFDPHANAACVERICAMVGGVPLAIEIAARAVRSHGCAGLAERIGAGGGLVDPDRDRADRHHSIEAIVLDAWAALPPPLRDALMRLAVLPGAFDPAVASGAAGVSPEEIAQLRDQSWLRAEADARLSIHPLQRDFALRQARAVAGLEEQVLDRLSGHWLAAMRAAREDAAARQGAVAPDMAGAPLRVDAAALEQIRACVAHRVERADDAELARFVDLAAGFLRAAGAWKDASRLLRAAVARESLPQWQRGLWVLRKADIESQAGDVERARRDFAQGLELLGFCGGGSGPAFARELAGVLSGRKTSGRALPREDRAALDATVAWAMMASGQLAAFAGEVAPSGRLAVLAWALARRARERDVIAMALGGFAYGGTLMRQGRAMRPLWRRASRLVSAPDRSPAAAIANETIGACEYVAGHWHRALPRLDETAAAMRRFQLPRYEVECRSLAAKILALQGRFDEAQRRFVAFGEAVRGSELTFLRHWSLLGVVETAMRTGSHDPGELLRLLAEARHEMGEIQTIDSAYVIRWLGLQAAVCAMAGEVEGAREAALSGAGVIAREFLSGAWAHEGFGGIVETLIACRARDRAIGLSGADLEPALEQSLRGMARQAGRFPPGRARLHFCRGLLASGDGRPDAARRHMHSAARLADRFGMRYELARACEQLASLEPAGGAASGEALRRARSLYEETGARIDLGRLDQGPARGRS